MATTVSETETLKIVRFFGGTDRGRTYEFINPETHKRVEVSEKELIALLGLEKDPTFKCDWDRCSGDHPTPENYCSALRRSETRL